MRNWNKLGIAVLAILLMANLAAAAVTGISTDAGAPVTRPFESVTTIDALGGNQSNISVDVETQTVAWQGFFGEVLGNITLADASDNILYAWLNATGGNVFASRNSSVDFSGIAAQNDCTIDESLTGTGSDRVNNTFSESSNTEFTIQGITIDASTACATNTYVNSAAQSTSFEEIILTPDAGITSVYATRIEENVIGFDNQTHDFQMIVPDFNNETTTTYFFYAELG